MKKEWISFCLACLTSTTSFACSEKEKEKKETELTESGSSECCEAEADDVCNESSTSSE